MAKFTSVNQTPATGAAAIFSLKQLLVSAGWVVKSSSNGTTYNSTGDQITLSTSLAATNAWFRIQDPGTQREFTFQRTTTNLLWRVKFSESAKFTGGTPGITQTPSATDEGVILGSGTDAAPTGVALFNTDNTYKCHSIAFSDVVSTNVYSFFFFTTDNTTGTPRTRIFFDGLNNTNALDTSPVGIFINLTAGLVTSAVLSPINTSTFAWSKYGLSGASFTNWHWTASTASGTVGPIPPTAANQSVSPNPFDSNEEYYLFAGLFRLQVDGATNYGFKGIFQRLAFGGNFSRAYPDTANLTTDAYAWVDSTHVVPWENNTAPTL